MSFLQKVFLYLLLPLAAVIATAVISSMLRGLLY